jgi:hypothetical protein
LVPARELETLLPRFRRMVRNVLEAIGVLSSRRSRT